jgi:menaquinone-dependent protoporphyrinogen oxidase
LRSALVIYATTHGHTGRIAARVADTLADGDHHVDLVKVEDAKGLDLATYELVVIGASVHAGHHQREIVDWCTEHAAELNATTVAFFSVSLTAADDSQEARDATAQVVQDFVAETGLHPQATVMLAGALQYREYDFFTRILMRMIARRHGQPTDTDEDIDYTDWEAVGSFAQHAATLARTKPAPTGAAG